MTRTALILAAHGSDHEPAVNEQIREYARQVSGKTQFDEYGVTFHQGDPHFSKVLDTITATDVTIVPVMASDGYYYSTVLPRELVKNVRYSDIAVRITPPVGTHDAIKSLVRRRALELVEQFGLSAIESALVVVGHGTPKNAQSRVSTIDVVEAIARGQLFWEVIPAFLDEEPFVESILPRVASSVVVVIPFLIAAGAHASQDIPRRMGITLANHAGRPTSVIAEGRTIVIDQSIGMDRGIIDIIVDLATCGEGLVSVAPAGASQAEARSIPTASAVGCPRAPLPRLNNQAEDSESCAGVDVGSRVLPPQVVELCDEFPDRSKHSDIGDYSRVRSLRLGTRGSKLAMWQANHVAGLLRLQGCEQRIDVELVEIATLGDRRLDLPIAELPSEGPFTDDIEESLRRGEIDFAVHALKDLPVFGADDLVIAAVLTRGDAGEALVSRDGLKLHELAAGSVIGTSSPRRAAQLLALRNDLRTTPIRGAVDARVRDVRTGVFDAVILATAGLERLELLGEVSEYFDMEEFLPAPGQAALVCQARRGDEATVRLLGRLEHAPTRLATDCELALLRYFDHRKDVALAAYAHVVDDEIHLQARLLAVDGNWSHQCHVVGTDGQNVADAAEKQLSHAFSNRLGAAV